MMLGFKWIGQLLISASAIFPIVVLASTFHGSIGVFAWHQKPSGVIRYDKDHVSGSYVNLKNDLGIGNGTAPYLRATLTNTLPVLPDLSLSYSKFDQSGTNTLNRTIIYGGQAYGTDTRVYGHLRLNEVALALYYRLIKHPVTFKLGVLGDHVRARGEVKDLTTGQASYATGSATIPAVYAGLNIPLPAGFSVGAQGAWIGYSGTHFDRWQAAAAWASPWDIGVKAGYREEDIRVTDRFNPHGDISFGGAFAGLFYRF